MTDEELLVRYRQSGNREDFAQLVKRYERELFSYLRRYLGDAEMAEDVFQATFLQVHMKCSSFEEQRRFRPWLYAIATNQAIDAQRRGKRHRMASLDGGADADSDTGRLLDTLESHELDPLENVNRLEGGARIQQALDGLSDSMRTVVNLVYYQGMKYREAAEVLSVPVGTVKSRLHAAIQKLSEAFESDRTPSPPAETIN